MNRMHSKFWAAALAALVVLMLPSVRAETASANRANVDASPTNSAPTCLPDANGFLRARLSGAVQAELNFSGAKLECSGGSRPKGGVRMRFTHAFGDSGELVFVFGIPKLREGLSGRGLSVNLTVIRQGAGEFYSSQGDDHCTIDEVHAGAASRHSASQS